MSELEALIQRKEMLLERISAMTYEIDKIDRRLVFLENLAKSNELDLLKTCELCT